MKESSEQVVLVEEEQDLLAIPLQDVHEVLRPLPVTRLPDLPSFVVGASLVRGSATPVLSLAALLGRQGVREERWVLLRFPEGAAALAVQNVLGVKNIPAAAFRDANSLGSALRGKVVQSIAAFDGRLLVFLDSAKLLPPSFRAAVEDSLRSVQGIIGKDE